MPKGNGLVNVQVLPTLSAEDLASEVPAGFDTVGHWWAVKEAEAIDLLYDPLGTFTADAGSLQTLCEKRGLECPNVKAGRSFQALGIDTVRAFPISLFLEFYPANP